MCKAVTLPFKVPVFATMQSTSAPELAMIGHPTAYNQVLNQAINIRCTRRFVWGFTSPEVNVDNIGLFCYGFLEHYMVNFHFVQEHSLDIIRAMLDSGMYVYYHGVDDFYMPGKSWYGIKHMYHDGIICGYDDNDKTLSIAAHDINWVYRLIRIPKESFIVGLKSALDAKYYGNMTAYRVKDDTTVEIDEQAITKALKEYLDSDFEKYPTDQSGEVKGIVVHNYLSMYIDKLKNGSIPYERMDWRALRPIWEHKRCMLDRIKAVEEKLAWEADISNRYAAIVDKADTLRIMYAMYHKNHNEKILDKVKNGLLDLADAERELIKEFIEKTEKIAL